MNIPLSPDEYRTRLSQKILLARSQEEVRLAIDEAMQALEANRVHEHAILRFVEIILSEFESYNAMQTDPQQWSNIALSKVLFERIRHQLTAAAS